MKMEGNKSQTKRNIQELAGVSGILTYLQLVSMRIVGAGGVSAIMYTRARRHVDVASQRREGERERY